MQIKRTSLRVWGVHSWYWGSSQYSWSRRSLRPIWGYSDNYPSLFQELVFSCSARSVCSDGLCQCNSTKFALGVGTLLNHHDLVLDWGDFVICLLLGQVDHVANLRYLVLSFGLDLWHSLFNLRFCIERVLPFSLSFCSSFFMRTLVLSTSLSS